MAGNKKLEEYENENYYLLWWLDKWHFPHNYLRLLDEDNQLSHRPITLWMWMFLTVLTPRAKQIFQEITGPSWESLKRYQRGFQHLRF